MGFFLELYVFYFLQLNLSLMKDRVVDLNSWRHENGTISVGPGNTWIEVYREVN